MMMHKNRLIFKIEGSEKNNHHLELSVFAEKTTQFLDFLKNSTKNSGEDKVVFYVVSLSHSSPAIIACEPKGSDNSSTIAAFNCIRKNLISVAEGQAHNLSNPVLSALQKLAEFNPQKVEQVEIQTFTDDDVKQVYPLDERFRENLIKARSEEDKAVSTIDGKLERVNIHQNANTFTIYTLLPQMSSVACKFPQELIRDVQEALGSFVSVWGKCFYRPDATFPYKIDVREMKVLPPSEKLPSLRDLYGIAPDATGDKSSEQLVREQRDEWSKEA